ncbi:MAG: DUF559 domain-containing protein [Solirubrobacterales bacterium]|nr:DUF559 domain-containing protein [Solirubrobacterales bacterium]
MAAVLTSAEAAVLSHLSAGLLWGILDRAGGHIHVLVAGPSSHRRPGLVMHRTRHLPLEHRAECHAIPVTTPLRTLLDLAAILHPTRLRFAVEAADRLNLLDVPSLNAMCDASPRRRGGGVLRRIAAEQRGPVGATKSPPERLFLRLCIRRGLPMPKVNARLEGYEVDFHWPDANLVVEIDSYTYHRSWAQRQRDIARDAHLKVCGHDVLRYVEDQLLEDEDAVFTQIEAMLAGRACLDP